ncbi:hypothetical protein P692DRAFT_20177644 [Suillus brevipes Sb2]|nr:hypothetical protein P692DRAFT_20177644 [Suillus brevipes Sb2]
MSPQAVRDIHGRTAVVLTLLRPLLRCRYPAMSSKHKLGHEVTTIGHHVFHEDRQTATDIIHLARYWTYHQLEHGVGGNTAKLKHGPSTMPFRWIGNKLNWGRWRKTLLSATAIASSLIDLIISVISPELEAVVNLKLNLAQT